MNRQQLQTWGWLAAGVLAMALNSVYHDGGVELATRIMDRVAAGAQSITAVASDRAQQLVERAGLVAFRVEAASCQLRTAIARFQALEQPRAVQTFDVMTARQEAQLSKLDASRARMEAQLAHLQVASAALAAPRVRVICPEVHVRVPRIHVPAVRIPAPIVRVNMGAGPV